MVDDFLVARNPEPGSTLPFLIRLPLGPSGIVLKAREAWPRTAKVYCHRAEWPDDAEIVAMDWHVKGVTTPLPQ